MNNKEKNSLIAIVPAAGKGSRMQMSQLKQYLRIGDKTVLEHTLITLLSHPSIKRIIVVLHPEDHYFHHLSVANNARIITTIGGNSRADSVLAGLLQAEQERAEWVLVHDAARPCLSFDDLNKLIDHAYDSQTGAILASPICDTLKRSDNNGNMIIATVDRRDLWQAFTPQMFPMALLKASLLKAMQDNVPITDEASAIEHNDQYPLLVKGRRDNIKITYPEDLFIADYYLSHRQKVS